MADTSSARAVRGIEAAAFVLQHSVQAYAVAGGEGARRLGDAMAGAGNKDCVCLEGAGLAAAQAVIGAAAAGKRTALIVSGEGVLEALPAIREMSRLGLPVLIAIASHGHDAGLSLPMPGLDEIAHLNALAVGVLVAADAEQVADFLMAGLRASADRGAPWVVAFELESVGLMLSNARLPTVDVVRSWAEKTQISSQTRDANPGHQNDFEKSQRDVERFGFALNSAMRDLERILRRTVSAVITDGATDAELVIVSTGAAARAARQAVPHLANVGMKHVAAIQVASIRPFPAADLVRLSWRARTVVVHEPWAEPLGVGGGFSNALRASYADALTWHPSFAGIGRIPPVVTVRGHTVAPEQWLSVVRTVTGGGDPPRTLVPESSSRRGGTTEGRIEIAMLESERDAALHLVVDWLARTGITVTAHAYEPTRAGISLARAEGSKAPSNVLIICPGGLYNPAQIESLPSGSVVVLAGDFPDRVLAETMRTGAPKGIRVATLHAHGEPLRGDAAIAAVVRAMIPADAAADSALETAVRESPTRDQEVVLSQVKKFVDALRGQFG